MTLRQHGILALLLFLGTCAVLLTSPRLSLTADEAVHTFAGTKWWETGHLGMQYINPPLPLISMSLLPYVFSSYPRDTLNGTAKDRYVQHKMLMRLGMLPYFIFSCLLVFLWSRRLYGVHPALWSLASYITLPPMLAYAGLAVTDLAYSTMYVWALMASVIWMQSPSLKNSILAGISVGLMVGTKFTGLLHWPSAMALIVLCQALVNDFGPHRKPLLLRKEHLIRVLTVVMPCFLLVLGLVYRFHYNDLYRGIIGLLHVNQRGYSIWLYHPLDRKGVWYFYPVILFFKTPLALQVSVLLASLWLVKEQVAEGGARLNRLYPLLAALAILLSTMMTNYNMGVRHILPFYPVLAISSGYALDRLWRKRNGLRWAAILLIAWQTAACLRSYPEYIAYFNELAGAHPERISFDSDFDWGQNIALIGEALEARGIKDIHLCLRRLNTIPENVDIYIQAHDLGCPDEPAAGWFAVARSARVLYPVKLKWLDAYEPVTAIGQTADLYYIRP